MTLSVTTPTFGGLKGSTDLATVITTGYSNVTTLTLNPGTGISDSYSGVIANGAMKLTKTGAGTQILSGANLYTGLTSVSAGTLRVNNTIGSGTGTGNVTVAASTSSGNYTGGMLGGSGNVSGAVTLVGNATAKLGGIIAAGADRLNGRNIDHGQPDLERRSRL